MKNAWGIWGGLLFLLAGCGSEGSKGSEQDVQGADVLVQDVAQDLDQTTGPEPEAVWTETKSVKWTDSGVARTVSIRYFRPQVTCTEETPCPFFVLIPDRLDSGLDTLSPHGIAMARATNSVVIIYNAPGRGAGLEQSSGDEDYQGMSGQDALVRVIKDSSMLKFVDPEHVGLVSVGYGLTAAAGALGRFYETGLAEVDYLIDVEGPINRCYTTQSPFMVQEDEGWYINEDGPGWESKGRCDFEMHPRKDKFPAGTSSDGKGTDGTPNSYICHANSFPLKQAGVTCDDDAFFQNREAKILLNRMGVHYLRLQFLYDHEQPTRLASIEAIQYASTNSNLKSVQLGDLPVDQAYLWKYTEKQLQDTGKAFLSISGVGNGFGTDVYAGSNFSPISAKELWQVVLPAYIKRMQDRSK